MPAPLPWNELAETTGFKNKREMLSTLYREWTSEAIAELLGIGRQTILNHLAQEGITKRKPGGYNTIKYKEILRIPKVKLEQMTSREIAEKIGITQEYTCFVCRKHNLKYKKISS